VEIGSYDTRRVGVKFGGQSESLNYLVDVSTFETDGYREHSVASRDALNSKFRWSLDDGTRLTLVVNAFDQPDNQDPLGLTAAQVEQDRRQAQPVALTFDTRRSLSNEQLGLVYERPVGADDTLRLLGYLGQRANEQFLAIPLFVQNGPLHSGGVSTIDRDFGGLGLRWTHRVGGDKPTTTVTSGVDYEVADDLRKGYLNDNGVQGALKRDEDNSVASAGAYLQAEWWLMPDWSVSGGLRYTRVSFESRDHFVNAGNPDDSGKVSHDAWTPVAGVLYRVNPALNLYANAGRSFETPTFIELAYRPDGTSGLNFDLKPSLSNHYEIGLKAFSGTDTRINLALFHIDTQDEIVVFTNSGGRATFQNAGDSQRRGVEWLIDSNLGSGFNAYLAYTYLDAKFVESFPACSGNCAAPNATVAAGNRIPGVPRNTVYGEFGWKHRASGFATAMEARWYDKVYVNDLNTEFASSYTTVNLRAGFEQNVERWRLREFVRVDNVLDEEYIGAVIVNDANGRYYAPAPTRNYLIGATVARKF